MSDKNKDLMNAEIFDEELSMIDGGSSTFQLDVMFSDSHFFMNLRTNISVFRDSLISMPFVGDPDPGFMLLDTCMDMCDKRNLQMVKENFSKSLECISKVYGSFILDTVYVQNINKMLEGK